MPEILLTKALSFSNELLDDGGDEGISVARDSVTVGVVTGGYAISPTIVF